MTTAKAKITLFDQPSVADLRDERIAESAQRDVLLGPDSVSDVQLTAVETEILVGSLRDGRLRVSAPFSVKFAVEEPHVIAEAAEFNEFGFGSNWPEALADLQRAISELYFTLEEGQEQLGTDLQKVWGRLQEKIQKR